MSKLFEDIKKEVASGGISERAELESLLMLPSNPCPVEVIKNAV